MVKTENLRRLQIPTERIDEINRVMFSPNIRVTKNFLEIVEKYGTPEEINAKAAAASQLPALLERVAQKFPLQHSELMWLVRARDTGAFITIPAYRRKVLGDQASTITVNEANPVTLEISACQYFSWFMAMAQKAVDNQLLMPGRYIRVRNMREQEADGDLLAFSAAMQIIGASFVEQLDTRGSDGSNIHLGGPDTLIGYYGGVGEPNDYPLRWLDEYLYYYTTYGIRQVLNVNSGTVLMGYMLHRLGVDIEFKISVTLGNDNPYSALWTLLTARLFARQDGSTPLVGFNWSNSVNDETIEITAQFRKDLGFEEIVRFEHHITETWKGIVTQPYLRRDQLVRLAAKVPNLSAKHEGGDPDVEQTRSRPSEIQDYFRPKSEIVESGDWENVTLNFQDKFDAMNRTARVLTENGLAFIAAPRLHTRTEI